MAHNYVVFDADEASVENALGEVAGFFEIFQMSAGNVGLSVPTKHLDIFDLQKLRRFDVLDFANGMRLEKDPPAQ